MTTSDPASGALSASSAWHRSCSPRQPVRTALFSSTRSLRREAHGIRSLARLTLLLLTTLLAPPAEARRRPPEGAAATVPASAAAFDLPTERGPVSLESLRGKVVLIDFWASWCGPCRQSFPWLSTMAERYRSSGLVVVAINLDKRREPAAAFLREFSPSFTVAFDPAGTTAEAYGVSTMPSSYVVDRHGRIVFEHAGFAVRDEEAIERRIEEAVAR
ncbi:MAG: TlpA family protein disulfide reductase [Holophagales bacterium]|nr:MAG: TlpA family protein disulfide reductase [Holophagales bacterium]